MDFAMGKEEIQKSQAFISFSFTPKTLDLGRKEKRFKNWRIWKLSKFTR